MSDLRVKVYGQHARFCLVYAESESGQDLIDSMFDPLAEHFHRGHMIVELGKAATLCSVAHGLRMGVTLDLR